MRPDPLVCALFLTVAFIAAGLVHSLWLKTRLSRRLLIPIDGGAYFRGRRVFGENKTVRGFVVMVPAAAAAFAGLSAALTQLAPSVALDLWPLSTAGYAALGAWAGLGFMLGELPNSFVKRQLDVAPGRRRSDPWPVVAYHSSSIGSIRSSACSSPSHWSRRRRG